MRLLIHTSIVVLLGISAQGFAQVAATVPKVITFDTLAAPGAYEQFLTPADHFDRRRFNISAGIAAGMYATASVGLYTAWYKGQGTGGFRTIDDSKEWEGMDKVGHVFTAYMYAGIANQGMKWAGVPKGRRLLLATGTSLLLQSTIEVMDGFSPAWGFSWHDMGANVAGAGLFVGQEALFGEQRILLKFSASGQDHSREAAASSPVGGPPRSPYDRAVQLYGSTPWTRFIKDYGGQTIWLSANPAVLVGRGDVAKLPWLNLAVGYSPNNIYGAFANGWAEEGYFYSYDAAFPRSHDFALSLDVDFTRIPTNNKTLKTLLFFAKFVKLPAPALLLNRTEGSRFKLFYF